MNSDDALDCGKPVNYTYYDNLVGVLNRHRHPNVPEPQVALILTKTKNNKPTEFDIDALERRLRKAKKEVSQHKIKCMGLNDAFGEEKIVVINIRF